jgi:hypothetical protein
VPRPDGTALYVQGNSAGEDLTIYLLDLGTGQRTSLPTALSGSLPETVRAGVVLP